MNNFSDFIIDNGILKKYRGPGGRVVIPPGVTVIGDEAFSRCTSLTHITFPPGLMHIGEEAFYECRGLTDFMLPDGVVQIDDAAFYGCTKLTRLTIPDTVHSIGAQAFCACRNLRQVILPDSVQSVGERAFLECRKLADKQGRIIVRNVLYGYHGDGTEAVIPPEVTHISRGSFHGCSGLTVYWPGKGTAGTGVFDGLERVVLPNMPFSYFTTPEAKFMAARGFLRAVDEYTNPTIRADYIKYAVTQRKKLLPEVFAEDLVPALMLYAAQKKITPANFETEYMNPATEANAAGCIAFLLNWNGAHMIPDSFETQLEKELMQDPLSAAELKKIWSYKTQPDGTLVLTSYKGDEQEITVPERIGRKAVTALGEFLFSPMTPEGKGKPAARRAVMTNIRSVVLPSAVTHIGERAFYGCHSLTDITIPDSVTHIGPFAFYGCKQLANARGFVVVRNVLYNYYGTDKAVTVPSGVTHIGAEAFCGCGTLQRVTIPEGVISIGEAAFMGCDTLQHIAIPASVTHIGGLAFSFCRELTIHGPAGSIAEQYANANEIPFITE
jgi:hypothetical protein